MKRLFVAVLIVSFLLGCESNTNSYHDIITMREKLNCGAQCKFTAFVTLDYGESLYTFAAECETDSQNNMSLTIVEPAAITGICCEIDAESGKLVFDDNILGFEMLADDQITPVCVPWLLLKTLRGGYISSYGAESVLFDDSFKGCEFSTRLYFGKNGLPSEAEFIWQGKRIASMTVADFTIV